jgi:uncharacterized membrane protein HdeD (DUF308 family)
MRGDRVLALVWPGKTLLTLGLLAGISLIVAAVIEIVDAIKRPLALRGARVVGR